MRYSNSLGLVIQYTIKIELNSSPIAPQGCLATWRSTQVLPLVFSISIQAWASIADKQTTAQGWLKTAHSIANHSWFCTPTRRWTLKQLRTALLGKTPDHRTEKALCRKSRPRTTCARSDWTAWTWNRKQVPANRLDYWQKSQAILQCFWKRWHLQQRHKWYIKSPNVSCGGAVLIKESHTPRPAWILGHRDVPRCLRTRQWRYPKI